jgi:tetratricopeptide (TPR) repeat protein
VHLSKRDSVSVEAASFKNNQEHSITFNNVSGWGSLWRLCLAVRGGKTGLCHVKKGQYEKALSDYKKALNLKHDDATIHNNLAWFYATAKDKEFQDKAKALEHALKAVELSKEKNAELLDTLARVYFINGKVREAVETERKALQLGPDSLEFKDNLKAYEKAARG